MSEEVIFWVTKYGYLAIFVMIFLQEIGMPNPFPNELLLIFSGYLIFQGVLYLPLVLLTTVLADFTGTSILYILFYKSGSYIIDKKPRWIPLSPKTINSLSSKVSRRGLSGIFIFRLTPFTRGYASVISGLLQIAPKPFLLIALGSAITWSLIYVFTGYLIGPYWNYFLENIDNFKYLMILVAGAVLISFLVFRIKTKTGKVRTN